MTKNFTINKYHFLSGMVLLLCLMSGQTRVFLEINGGVIYQLIYYLKYFATAALFAYAISRRREIPKSEAWQFIYLLTPIIILMFVVEFFAMFASPISVEYGIRYWTRSISLILDRFAIYVAIISVWMLCSDKAIDCMADVFLLDEFFILVSAIIQDGIASVGQNIVSAFTFREFDSNFFEVHELTFAIGLCIIYYLFFQKKEEKKISRIVLLIISFILGGKRIGLFAILVAGLFAIFIHRKGLSRHKLVFTGIIGVIMCFSYLFIIYNNEFFALLNKYNVNNMGRDLIYEYYVNRTQLSPSHIGWGIAGVSKVIENMSRSEVQNMVAARGLHNDILKIYINFGFFGSLIWYAINLIYFPIQIMKKYGKKPATIYMTLALYMFVTYLTDNTEGYFVCQIALFLVPLAEYWSEKKSSTRILKPNDKPA